MPASIDKISSAEDKQSAIIINVSFVSVFQHNIAINFIPFKLKIIYFIIRKSIYVFCKSYYRYCVDGFGFIV